MQGRLENEMKLQKTTDEALKDMPEYVSRWESYIKSRGTSPASRLEYVRKLNKFFKYIDDDTINIKVEQLNKNAVESFIVSIKTKRNSDGLIVNTSHQYQSGFMSVLRSFFDFLLEKGYIKENPARNIGKNKHDINKPVKNEINLLTKNDFKKIIDAAENSKPIGARGIYKNRDCLVLLLMMTMGIRESILLEIDTEDINFKERTLTTINKSNKIITYRINKKTFEYLSKWMEDRHKININNRKELLIGMKGERLSVLGIHGIVKKYSKIGIGKEVTPSELIYSFCSILYDETRDIEFIKKVTGYSSAYIIKKLTKKSAENDKTKSEIIESLIEL